MTTEQDQTGSVSILTKSNPSGGSSGAVYGLGLIGAWVFYISRASSVQEGLIGFLKGFVWPAFLVYDLLKFLDKDQP